MYMYKSVCESVRARAGKWEKYDKRDSIAASRDTLPSPPLTLRSWATGSAGGRWPADIKWEWMSLYMPWFVNTRAWGDGPANGRDDDGVALT